MRSRRVFSAARNAVNTKRDALDPDEGDRPVFSGKQRYYFSQAGYRLNSLPPVSCLSCHDTVCRCADQIQFFWFFIAQRIWPQSCFCLPSSRNTFVIESLLQCCCFLEGGGLGFVDILKYIRIRCLMFGIRSNLIFLKSDSPSVTGPQPIYPLTHG